MVKKPLRQKPKKVAKTFKAAKGKVIEVDFPSFVPNFLPTPSDFAKPNSPEEVAVRETMGEAQELCYDAFECVYAKDKVALALHALSLHPKCSDAWYLLGEYVSKDPIQKMGYFRNGILAAEEYFGSRLSQLPLWGIVETRPYMRCRFAFAQALWAAGIEPEAIEEGWKLVKDNPNDNQGMRYVLIGWLLARSEWRNAQKLLESYPEDFGVQWPLAKLMLTLGSGNGPDSSDKTIKELLKRNPHVREVLCSKAKPTKAIAEYYEVGSREEVCMAVQSLSDFRKRQPGVWRAVCEAICSYNK